jgi:hypothetical protein
MRSLLQWNRGTKPGDFHFLPIWIGRQGSGKLPAQKPGGLYKTGNHFGVSGFVEAVPSRDFRDGSGILEFGQNHCQILKTEPS